MNMKFIRKPKVRERLFDYLSKALLIGISVLACLWMVSGAHAAPNSITGIKSQPQADGSVTIDFVLSQKPAVADVSVEYERNFIQVSLKGVSAYPARTETIGQSVLERVFTYQYQPDLARARVLLKSPATSIKGRSSWELTSQGIRITVKGAAKAVAASDAVKTKAAAVSDSAPISADTDEERIVQEILSESRGAGSKPAAASSEDTALFKSARTEKAEKAEKLAKTDTAPSSGGTVAASTEDQAVFGTKSAESVRAPESNASRIATSLILVVGLIGAAALGYRRFALGKGITFQRQPRVIEVISQQSLGPKRSIAVVKVLDQYMVVGMSGDGMSLLSNLGSDVKIEKFLDSVGGPGAGFADAFDGALAGISASSPIPNTPLKTDTAGTPISHRAAQLDLGIRSAIKKRMEGFKPL